MKNFIDLIETLERQGDSQPISATIPTLLPQHNKIPLSLIRTILGFESKYFLAKSLDRESLISLIAFTFTKDEFTSYRNKESLLRYPAWECSAFPSDFVILPSVTIRKEYIRVEHLPVYIKGVENIKGFESSSKILSSTISPIGEKDYKMLIMNQFISNSIVFNGKKVLSFYKYKEIRDKILKF